MRDSDAEGLVCWMAGCLSVLGWLDYGTGGRDMLRCWKAGTKWVWIFHALYRESADLDLHLELSVKLDLEASYSQIEIREEDLGTLEGTARWETAVLNIVFMNMDVLEFYILCTLTTKIFRYVAS